MPHNYRLYALFLIFFFDAQLYGHGFAEHTLVKKAGHWWAIEQILANPQHETISVLSYNHQENQLALQPVHIAGHGNANCYCDLHITDGNEHTDEIIKCAPTQEFFLPKTGQWVPVYKLKHGDVFLSADDIPKWVRNITLHKEPLKVYSFEVENTHNFFVGRHTVLTHNIVIPAVLTLGLSIPFGAGAAAGGATGCFLGPVAIVGGCIIGGAVGVATKLLINHGKTPEFNASINIGEIDRHLNPPFMLQEKVEDQPKAPPQGDAPQEKSKDAPKTIEDVLEGAQPGEKTKGGTKQYEKPGGFAQALEDFESLPLKDVVEKSTEKKLGVLPDGKVVNVRVESSAKKPTLEIYNPETEKSIKIRYEE